MDLTVKIPNPNLHPKQLEFVRCKSKRIIIRAGRRGGKTVGVAIRALEKFLDGWRVLYAAPTEDQVGTFWYEIKNALAEPIDAKILYKNESKHIIEFPGTKKRIRAKTAYDADTLRGDYADLLILDEWQMMNEDAWEKVGSPMLLDNGGDAVFIYTPPSRKTASRTRAMDPMHATKMFKNAMSDPRWATFSFSSHDNPFLNREALKSISEDMTSEAYSAEILAIDTEDSPAALWQRNHIDHVVSCPRLVQIAIGVDPPGGRVECGIVAVGMAIIDGKQHVYVIDDSSINADESTWGSSVVALYNKHSANAVVVETNYGGTMASFVIKTADTKGNVFIRPVSASRGKDIRAEPIAAMYQHGRGHHLGHFHTLENEMCQWIPHSGAPSPNRLDALVWAATYVTNHQHSGRST
jgi:hypothetical protein